MSTQRWHERPRRVSSGQTCKSDLMSAPGHAGAGRRTSEPDVRMLVSRLLQRSPSRESQRRVETQQFAMQPSSHGSTCNLFVGQQQPSSLAMQMPGTTGLPVASGDHPRHLLGTVDGRHTPPLANNLNAVQNPHGHELAFPLLQPSHWLAADQTDSSKDCVYATRHDGPLCSANETKLEKARANSKRWTSVEHHQYLTGLEVCGPGNWRRISEHFVPTRTPTQVASHHQKFSIRSQLRPDKKKRGSVLDTTTPAVEKLLNLGAEDPV